MLRTEFPLRKGDCGDVLEDKLFEMFTFLTEE